MELTVYPRQSGEIRVEQSLDTSQNNIMLGSIISYTINITNIGQTDIAYLPLVDDYPKDVLEPITSYPPWNENDALVWNNLLDKPLPPGNRLRYPSASELSAS